MKAIKKCLAILLSLTIVFSVMGAMGALNASAATSGKCGDNLSWSFDSSKGVLTISGKGDMYEYNYIDYEEVEILPPWEEHADKIKSVTVGDGVTSITDYAFAGYEKLASVKLPSSLKRIGVGILWATAFSEDEKNWDKDDCLYIGSYLLDSYAIGSYTIKAGTKIIAGGAFFINEDITKVTIPNTVTSIGEDAFLSCTALSSINIPASVERIEYDAFYDTAYYNKESNWKGNCLYLDKALIAVGEDYSGGLIIEDSTTIIADAVALGKDIEFVTIPGSVKSISFLAFGGCYSLEEIIIKNGVERIESSAFVECASVSKVSLPASLKHIGDAAFWLWPGYDEDGVISEVYYDADQEAWNKIEIKDYNHNLTKASIKFKEPDQPKLGDVNGDTRINSADALLVLQFATNMATLSDAQQKLSDVNLDEKINSADALAILQFATGLAKF